MKVNGTPLDKGRYRLTVTGEPRWARRLIFWVAIRFSNKRLIKRDENYALFEGKP